MALRLFVLLMCVLCVGCQSRETLVEEFVSKQLKDPHTAQFSEIRTHPSEYFAVSCGIVNSKNSFGAYAGPTKFLVAYGRVIFEDPSVTESLDSCCSFMLAYDPSADSDRLPSTDSAFPASCKMHGL